MFLTYAHEHCQIIESIPIDINVFPAKGEFTFW